VDENLITPSNALLPGWSIPQWDELDEVALPEKLTLAYHLPVELHAMAEQLCHALALLGCELTLIFHNAKNWMAIIPSPGRPDDGRQADW
jgi:MarR-like DNA-binding transcriptional regulator SgrR of sgrS sRNA